MVNRRSLAEDRVDFSIGYYVEDHHRVEVWSPVLLWEADLNRSSIIRVQGVYDVVSGASPTGAPLTRNTKAVTQTANTTQNGVGIVGYNVVSGPSGTKRTPIYGTVSQTAKTQQTVYVPYGEPFLPTHEFHDERMGLNLELENRVGDWLLDNSVSFGQESDYESVSGTVKVGREFNHKATVLSAAVSFGHDWVERRALNRWDGKDSVEGLLSVAQVINTTTLLTVSGSLGSASGYLDDQYKYASVNNAIIPEHRPDHRERRVAYVMLNHMFEPLHGSLEASYRFYNDSYGIDANTFGLTWLQNIGKHWVVAPSVRYYEQSAASFYAPQFTGKPEYYSADYRLARLSTFTYGLKVVWKQSDRLQFNIGYDRYSMQGRDGGLTPAAAFPSANIFTMGVKVWY